MSERRSWESEWRVEDHDFGRGGQGKTLLVSRIAEPHSQGVLKLLKHQADTKARLRMHREVTNLRTLANQGLKVPHVLDGNTEQNENPNAELYFVMERVPGSTLERAIKERSRLPLEHAVAMTLDLCGTVSAAHREGVLHRDLKPANIIARDFDKADLVIVDYGLSFNEAENEDDSLTDTGEQIGNRFYRPHEFTLPGGHKRDHRSDVASLSAIFYYCLTGWYPYQPLDGHGKLPHQREGCSVREPLKDHPRVKDVEAILDRGFAPDFDSRFHTPEELADRLTSLIRPVGSGERRDLAQVSRDAAVKLRRHSRAARLAEFTERLGPVLQQLYNLVTNCLRELDPIFAPAIASNTGYPMPPGIDKLNLDDLTVSLGVKGTDASRYVIFRFCADREECALVRVIAGAKGGTADQSRSWEKLRWSALQQPPSADDLFPLVKEGLVLAIDELVEGL
jgi:serine/threonine-protein kinase